MLAGTPFHSFLLPGLLLFTFVGIGPIVAAAVTPRQRAIGPLAAMAVGVTLMTWIIVEMVLFARLRELALGLLPDSRDGDRGGWGSVVAIHWRAKRNWTWR